MGMIAVKTGAGKIQENLGSGSPVTAALLMLEVSATRELSKECIAMWNSHIRLTSAGSLALGESGFLFSFGTVHCQFNFVAE